ncbi:MAG: tetratricopeptide repeat protein [Promethearchaeota archaeon]|jgi:tetratricopeptide (TPR) repeat protein
MNAQEFPSTFQNLKRMLELDQKVSVRLSAAKELFQLFKNKSKSVLKTQIQKEKSALFLTEYYRFLINQEEEVSQSLMDILIKKYQRIYEVTYEEIVFIIDLEATQINSKKELDIQFGYFKKFIAKDIETLKNDNQKNYVMRNHHIIAFDFSRWEFQELPESIGLLSEIEYLILANLNLKALPESIKCLSKLKYLNLNGNNLIIIPNWLIEFINRALSERYILEDVLPSEATVLGLLEVLSGQMIEKTHQYDDVMAWEIASHYRINEKGNIKGIYLRDNQSNIGILPKQICSLKFLEELDLPNSNIKSIPNCIGKLFSLKFLNLSMNRINSIPESIEKLKNLEYLNIDDNLFSEKELLELKWYKNGLIPLEGDKFEMTIKECESTLKTYPKNMIALFHLGIAYREVGNLDLAKQAYKRFLDIDPLSSVVWSSLSDIYHQEGDYDKAITAIKNALDIEPDIALLWSNLGLNFKKLGKHDDAIEAYLQSLEIDSNNKYVWKDLASIYQDKGDYMKATEAEEQALGAQSKNNLDSS